jgi:hypothetical protein
MNLGCLLCLRGSGGGWFPNLLCFLLRCKLLLHLKGYGVSVDFVGRGSLAEDDGGIGASRRQENGGFDQQA